MKTMSTNSVRTAATSAMIALATAIASPAAAQTATPPAVTAPAPATATPSATTTTPAAATPTPTTTAPAPSAAPSATGKPTATQPAAAATLTPGSTVVDASGATVGTIASVKGSDALVKTDKYEILIPQASFSASNGKAVVGMTQAQLNSEYETALAKAKASMVVGANVNGPDGASVGTISAMDDQSVTLKLTGGALVRLEKAAVAPGTAGAVVGATAAELKAMSAQAKKTK